MTNLKREIIAFIVVGIINTLFGYALFCLFIFIGLHHLWAISLAFIGGVLFNFQTIRRFVFRSHDQRLIIKFTLLYIFLYFINIGLIESLQYFIHNWYLNGGITIIISAVLSFGLNKFWVFRKKGALK